jgi:protein-disulfide isomerase
MDPLRSGIAAPDFNHSSTPDQQPSLRDLRGRPVGLDDHVLGSRDAPVVLVEYGDFECPRSAAACMEVDRVRARMGELMVFVYRHFPLTTVHARARRAAEASEAAGAQGRFWEMHHMLFAHQEALEDDDVVSYALRLGLDRRRFVAELIDETHGTKVRHDFLSGMRSGVNATPAFFINGVRHNGSYDQEALLTALQQHAVHGV